MTIDNIPRDQESRAMGWVKGTSFEFKGSKVTVVVPAEEPRTGEFKVTRTVGQAVLPSRSNDPQARQTRRPSCWPTSTRSSGISATSARSRSKKQLHPADGTTTESGSYRRVVHDAGLLVEPPGVTAVNEHLDETELLEASLQGLEQRSQRNELISSIVGSVLSSLALASSVWA
ncbi:MAG: hypothetical protein U0165_12690 [Polyangiaceae bacterium]